MKLFITFIPPQYLDINQNIHKMSMNLTFKLEKRPMLVEKFVHLLLIFRVFLKQLSPLTFAAIIIALLVVKKIKEGFSIATLGQIISLQVIFMGDLLQWPIITQWGTFIATLNYIFLEPNLYQLPEFKQKIGLRENFSQLNKTKKLYWTEWYPLSNPTSVGTLNIKWNHTIEMQKMMINRSIEGQILKKLFKFFNSHINHINLKLGKGSEAENKGIILFSHGRTATPFMYTNFFKAFGRERKIFAPQHSEVLKTPYQDKEDIKKYREKQVRERAEQIVFLAQKVGEDKTITLMGHSYGCSTIMTAYHILPLSIRKRVKQIILFDPWLFPMTQQHFEAEITCRVLMLANQYFIEVQDAYDRNKRFMNRHNDHINYLCWKGADHLHQCDIPYIIGSSLKAIKNLGQCGEMLQRNIEAVNMFYCFESIGQGEQKLGKRFKDVVVEKSFMPKKWNNRFQF